MSDDNEQETDAATKYFGRIVFVVLLLLLAWKFCYPVLLKLKNKLILSHLRFARAYNKAMCKTKEKLFHDLHKLDGPVKIVEIGAGDGTNFNYYPSNCEVICVDRECEFQDYLRANTDQYPHIGKVEFVITKTESMGDLLGDTVDAVVTNLVLCSVSNADKVLREIKKILKPVSI